MKELLSFVPLLLIVGILGIAWRWSRKASTDPALSPLAVPSPAAPTVHYSGPLAFFRRHLNGDYSLGRSYWLHTFVLQLALVALVLGALPALVEDLPARVGSSSALFVSVGSLALWLWGVIGTWRSAGKHVSRGGRATWANLAKVAIILGALRAVADVGVALPSFKEHWQVAWGKQLGAPVTLELRADGKSLLLSGGINDGSAAKLEEALGRAPGVRTIVLASDGGWIREGERLAAVIRERKLNTYVEQRCSSACTVAFLAGVDRAAAPDARIGFHAARFVGAPAGVQESSRLKKLYQQAGLPAPFVEKALSTDTKDMWYPSQSAMIDAGVLTRRSSGGETAALATSTRSREDLENGLRKVALFDLFAQRDPQTFGRMMDAAWDGVQRGAPDSEVIRRLREVMLPAVMAYVPLASEELVLQYHELTIAQVEALERIDLAACGSLVFGDEGAQRAVGLLPKELREREIALLTKALQEGDERLRRRPTQTEVSQAATTATREMRQDQLDLFIDDALRKAAPPAKRCEAAKAWTASVAALPKGQRASVLRVLYSNS